jgi:hypothetical protein
VIHDVDESLRSLVRRDVIRGADVDVVLDAPTKEWAGRRNAPTIDIYLYDIREDLRRRQFGVVDVHDDAGHTVARRQPVRFFKLSYLLTAWTQRPEDEHRLLAALLHCFLRNDHIPRQDLVGTLAEEDVPFQITMAIPPPEDRALSDVWSALGGELKPSLDLVVITPVDLDRTTGTAVPVSAPPVVEVGADGIPPERAGRHPPSDGIGDAEPPPAPPPSPRPARTETRRRRTQTTDV